MYKETKRFSSLDGRLEVDDRTVNGHHFGMSQMGLDEIGDAKPHLGGATHIFVKVKGGPSNSVIFMTRNKAIVTPPIEEKAHGWAEFNIEHGSSYRPDLGEVGWWNYQVANAPSEIVEGFGLPYSHHVSWFSVVEWFGEGELPEQPGEGEPEIPTEPEGKTISHIEIKVIYTDGTSEQFLTPEAMG